MVNAVIHVDVTRLNVPLRPLFARQLNSFAAVVLGIPADVSSVTMRVFKVGGGFFDIPLTRGASGSIAKIIGPMLPEVGSAKYELHGFDEDGMQTALGVGIVQIDPFSASGEPLEPGEERPVMQIRDRSGALHNITAIYDGDNWTSVIDDDWSVGNE